MLTKKQIETFQINFVPTAVTSGTVNDENNYIEVSRRGQYQVSGLSASNEYLFKGSENPLQVRTVFSLYSHPVLFGIQMRRNYTVDFLCHFELENYPFDRQLCDVGLVSVDGQVRLVRAGHSPRYNTVEMKGQLWLLTPLN